MNVKSEKCSDKVQVACDSRLSAIKSMLVCDQDMIELYDDGTSDTVLSCGDELFRYSDTTSYRNEISGLLDLDSLIEDESDTILEAMRERFYDYALAFDYVAPETFNDQPEGYFRYQISYGGPSEEIRFYVNPDFSLYRAEFWYLDWFDGAKVTLDIKSDVVAALWAEFYDTESAKYEFEKTMHDNLEGL